jgi:hypothetical protein
MGDLAGSRFAQIPVVDEYLAAGSFLQQQDKAQQRAFSGSGMACEKYHLAGAHVKTHIL